MLTNPEMQAASGCTTWSANNGVHWRVAPNMQQRREGGFASYPGHVRRGSWTHVRRFAQRDNIARKQFRPWCRAHPRWTSPWRQRWLANVAQICRAKPLRKNMLGLRLGQVSEGGMRLQELRANLFAVLRLLAMWYSQVQRTTIGLLNRFFFLEARRRSHASDNPPKKSIRRVRSDSEHQADQVIVEVVCQHLSPKTFQFPSKCCQSSPRHNHQLLRNLEFLLLGLLPCSQHSPRRRSR